VAAHRILARYDRWIVLLYTTFSAGLFWLIVNPPWKLVAAHYSEMQWGFLAVFAVVSVLAPFSLYFAGLQHLEPTRAIVASCLEPVFSIVLAAVLLGEGLRPAQMFGIGIVLAAIVIVQLPERDGGAGAVIEPIE
jgi:DME family drug/metabolite transporter